MTLIPISGSARIKKMSELCLSEFIGHLNDCLDFYGDVPIALMVDGCEREFVLESCRVRWGKEYNLELHMVADD